MSKNVIGGHGMGRAFLAFVIGVGSLSFYNFHGDGWRGDAGLPPACPGDGLPKQVGQYLESGAALEGVGSVAALTLACWAGLNLPRIFGDRGATSLRIYNGE
jgi:hypothetical protein